MSHYYTSAKACLLVVFCLLILGSGTRCLSRKHSVDASTFLGVDRIIQNAIVDSVFPGAVLCVGNRDGIFYIKAYGGFDYTENARPTEGSTIFDLASLTKVIATTSSVMVLHEEGRLELDIPVAHYIPEFAQRGKADITIRNLLVHNSGFPAGKPFYKICKSKDEAYDSLYAMPLSYATGTKTIYSDLGFITLGRVVEIITGTPLDVFVGERLFQPLRMRDTMFSPPDSLWPRVAPTEPEYNYRLTKSPGKPRNRITQLMGGVAGHAGLFSTADDLSKVAIMYLNQGAYGGRRFFSKSTVELFTTRQSTSSTRALGWDTGNGNEERRISHSFTESAFGHTGFTGTSFWVDPGRDLFVIFLSNRTYEMKDRQKILDLRPQVHDEIIRSLSNQ